MREPIKIQLIFQHLGISTQLHHRKQSSWIWLVCFEYGFARKAHSIKWNHGFTVMCGVGVNIGRITCVHSIDDTGKNICLFIYARIYHSQWRCEMLMSLIRIYILEKKMHLVFDRNVSCFGVNKLVLFAQCIGYWARFWYFNTLLI